MRNSRQWNSRRPNKIPRNGVLVDVLLVGFNIWVRNSSQQFSFKRVEFALSGRTRSEISKNVLHLKFYLLGWKPDEERKVKERKYLRNKKYRGLKRIWWKRVGAKSASPVRRSERKMTAVSWRAMNESRIEEDAGSASLWTGEGEEWYAFAHTYFRQRHR